MVETIRTIASTPLPTIFILAGMVFLLLSVANKLGANISLNPKRQGISTAIGITCIEVVKEE